MSITATKQVKLWIDNEEIAADRTFEVRDPGRRSDIVAIVANGTAEDADRAVQAAHRAFREWRRLDRETRVQRLLQATDALQKEVGELAPLLVREHGGVLWEAQADLQFGVGINQFTSAIAEKVLASEHIEDGDIRIRVDKVPRGVVVAVVPWNFPIVLTMMKLAPALIAGNTLVVKPSPYAPAAISEALKIMSGKLPPGVINVIHGDAEVGSTLTQHPLVRKISFTGGVATATHVMRSAADSIKNLTLELGGNDPAIILDDFDINEMMPRLAKGIFTRSGQICFAVKRVYVPSSLYERVFEKLCEVVDDFKVGHGLDDRTTFGPVNNETQYHFVKGLVDRTRASNAVVRELGQKVDPESWNEGYYILPHVVKDVGHFSELVSCEQFGPVIPLIPYHTVDEAITMANDSEMGLCSSVWSKDVERAVDIAAKLEAGSTFVNSHSLDSLDPRMPFGGIKQSGIGREFADLSLMDYVEYHAIRYSV